MSFRAATLGIALAAAIVSVPAYARDRGPATPSVSDDQKKAEEHFARARELYSTGKYEEAVEALLVARQFDPKAKELVMNLAIVYEKLDRYDEAIAQLRTFLEMEGVTAAERTKAEGSIRRLLGAKTAAAKPKDTQSSESVRAATPPPKPSPEPGRGRVDGLTVGAGALAVVGFGLGAGLGLYALRTRPTASFVTGRDGTYADLIDRTNDAHRAAVASDVSLGVGALATIAAAWLYFGRTKEPASTTRANTSHGLSVAASVTPAGAGLGLSGAF